MTSTTQQPPSSLHQKLRPLFILLLFLPVVFWLTRSDGNRWFHDAQHRDVVIDEMASLAITNPESAFLFTGGWEAVGNGVSPVGSKSGSDDEPTIRFRINQVGFDQAQVRIDGARESRWSVAFSAETPNGELRRILYTGSGGLNSEEKRLFSDDELPASQFAFSDISTSGSLMVELRPLERGNQDDALLRRVELVLTPEVPTSSLALPNVLVAGLAPFLFALFAFLQYRISVNKSLIVGLPIAGVVLYMILKMPEASHHLYLFGALISAYLGSRLLLETWRLRPSLESRNLFHSDEQKKNWAFFFLLLFVVLIGLQNRWEFFQEYQTRALGYDASGYVEIASTSHGLYETAQSKPPWVREPLFPWMLQLWFGFFPETQNSARIGALLFSTLLIGFAGWVGRLAFGRAVGLSGALMLAIVPEWAFMGIRVLRHDTILFLFLSGIVIRQKMDSVPIYRSWAWGLWASSMFLLQFSLGIISVPLLIWEGIRTKWKPIEIGLVLLLLVIFVTPHLVFNARYNDTGDPFYSSSIHTLYYLNASHAGEEGFPTALEFIDNPYVGDPVSGLEFFFKYHTVTEVALGHLRGYWNLFVWHQPRLFIFKGIELLMLPGLLGAWLFLRAPGWRKQNWILAYSVVFVLPFVFLSSIGADLRLGMEATIVSNWIWALGVWWLCLLLVARIRKKEKRYTQQTKAG